MTSDLEFLDELTAFLDTETLGRGFTPRSSLQPSDSWTRVSRVPVPNSGSQDGDSEGHTSSGNESTKRTTKRKNRGEPADARRKKYLQRVKDERTGLHEKVNELSAQLREMLGARVGAKTTPRTDLILSESFWKDVATRQREQREQAEAEQKRLTSIVNAQAAYMRSFGVKVHPNSESTPAGSAASTLKSVAKLDKIDDLRWLRLKSSVQALFTTFLEELDTNYAQIDDVFRECKLDSLPIGSVDPCFKLTSNGGLEYFQLRKRVQLPFRFEHTCSKIWEMAKLPYRQGDREIYEDVSGRAHTFAFRHRLKQTLKRGVDVSILKNFLIRQYIEKDRAVVIWKVFSEGEGIFSGMDTDEVSWVSIRPVSETETLMEVHARQIPVPFIMANTSNPTVKEFQKMMEDAVQEDEQTAGQLLMKLLTEESQGDSSSPAQPSVVV